MMEVIILLLLIIALLWRWRKKRSAKASTTDPTSSREQFLPTSQASETRAPTPARRAKYRPAPRFNREVSDKVTFDVEDRSTRHEIPFAEAHHRGPLFKYAGPPGASIRGIEHNGPYAVIDLETTGLSPRSGDRVVELAVARVDRYGRIEDEFATLINPDGADTGPVFIHGISNDAVRGAPRFADIAAELLARLEGAVVVVHNAPFEEAFLAAEFKRAGIKLPGPLPALCTLWLAQRTVPTANHRLGTLCRHAEIPLVDKHSALGDVRAVAALLPQLLECLPTPLIYTAPPLRGLADGLQRGRVRPKTRAAQLRKGTDGWMASILDRLPMSAAEADDLQASSYLEALSDVLSDGRILGEEAKQLAKIAGAAGLGSAQVAALNSHFLDQMHQTALEDEVLTMTEIHSLLRAATALGEPNRFTHLVATPTSKPAAQPSPAMPIPPDQSTIEGLSNGASRVDRVRRALLAVEQQRSGATRESIALGLGVSLETVKQLLRDGKFYLNTESDPTRLAMARSAVQARQMGKPRAHFRASQALSSGKAAEAWRDAAYLISRDSSMSD